MLLLLLFITLLFASVNGSDIHRNFRTTATKDSRAATSNTCDDEHSEVIAALNAAFKEENCYVTSLDGDNSFYGCAIEMFWFGGGVDARATYEYDPDDNNKPISLEVSDLDTFESINFDDSCLVDLESFLSSIEESMKCREDHDYVLETIFAAFGEDNCLLVLPVDREDEGRYCEVTVEDFSASVDYWYSPGENEPLTLSIRYGGDSMSMQAQSTDFVANCIDNFAEAFKTIRGYTFDSCDDTTAEIIDKMTAVFPNPLESCLYITSDSNFGFNGKDWYECDTANTDVQGFRAYAKYEFDPLDDGQPRSLQIEYGGNSASSAFFTDLSPSNGCLADFENVFQSISNGVLVCADNKVDRFTYSKNNGGTKETSCQILGNRGKPRMTQRLCKMKPEVQEQCPGLCRIKKACKCYNNPFAFVFSNNNGNKMETRCSELEGMTNSERKQQCRDRRIKTNCPGFCKRKCRSMRSAEDEADEVIL